MGSSLLKAVAMTALLMGLSSLITSNGGGVVLVVEATWCVSRSDASDQALQTALDYACGAGADCQPIQSSGLCYLPNTMQAHASYAFNSYYQLKSNAPGSCDFSGTATVAKTDPSYGSCVYPSSPRTAGGTGGTGTTTSPSFSAPPPPGAASSSDGGGGLTPGGLTPDGPLSTNTNESKATLEFSVTSILISISWFLFLLFICQPM